MAQDKQMATVKSVLVTGCSEGGIGFALVKTFQKRGLRVFATARDLSKVQTLAQLPNVIILNLDPTNQNSAEAAAESVSETTGGTLDYLVNNAGQTIIMPTLDFDIERAKAMYNINLWGAVRIMQVFAPLVVAAKGTIISNCSISSSVNTPWMGLYTGSKAALEAVTDALRLEMAPLGVKVVTIHTGAVSSRTLETGKDFHLPEESLFKDLEINIAGRARGEDGTPRMTPEEYAERVVRDVLSGSKPQIWRGGYASVVRFTSSWFPSFVSDWMSIQGTGLEAWKPLKL